MSLLYLNYRILITVFVIVTCLTLLTTIYGQDSKCSFLFPISSITKNKPNSPFVYDYKWGFMDCWGNIIIKPEYEKVFEFHDGVGVLIKSNNSVLINLKGNKKMLPDIRVLTRFSEGVAIAIKQNRFIIINKSGKVISELPEFSDELVSNPFVTHFSNGLALFATSKGVGFIDKSGKFVIDPEFDNSNGFHDGMASVIVDGKFALIDTSGKFIIPPIEDKNIGVLDPSDGLAKVYTTVRSPNDITEYYNKQGKIVLKVQYDYAGNFSEGLAIVNNKELWGFINKKGIEVIPIKFYYVKDFSEGLAGAAIGIGKWGFVNKTGEFVIPPTFESIESSFNNGLAYVRKNGLEGYINKKGKWIWKRKSNV